MELTGDSYASVMAITPADDWREDGYGQRLVVRLAMMARGENPIDVNRVDEILDMPLDEYFEYIRPVMDSTAMECGVTENPDGTLTIHLPSVDVPMRQLRGREAHLLMGLNSLPRLKAMTGLTEEMLRAMPYGEYALLEKAADPFVQESVNSLNGTTSSRG